jgi:hypothetical protein
VKKSMVTYVYVYYNEDLGIGFSAILRDGNKPRQYQGSPARFTRLAKACANWNIRPWTGGGIGWSALRPD